LLAQFHWIARWNQDNCRIVFAMRMVT
jgi:hypothetical protein